MSSLMRSYKKLFRGVKRKWTSFQVMTFLSVKSLLAFFQET